MNETEIILKELKWFIEKLDTINVAESGQGSLDVMEVRDAISDYIDVLNNERINAEEIRVEQEARLADLEESYCEMQNLNRQLMLKYGNRLEEESRAKLGIKDKEEDENEKKKSLTEIVEEINI